MRAVRPLWCRAYIGGDVTQKRTSKNGMGGGGRNVETRGK